ncbi:MAG: hypothetical protein OEY28_10025 [Nitrospira sp.]|nr:hypothetical protein [Nitrospira sp.]
MSRFRERAVWLSLVVIASAFTHAAGIAHAQPSIPYTACTGRSVELLAVGQRSAFDISIPVGQVTTLVFPYKVESFAYLDAPKEAPLAGAEQTAKHFDIVQLADQNLIIMAFADAPKGETMSIEVTGGNITLRLRFRVAESLETATASVFVKTDRPPGDVLEHPMCISVEQQADESARRLRTLTDEAQECLSNLRQRDDTSVTFTTEQADRVILRDVVSEKGPAPLDAAQLGPRGVFFVGPMVVCNGSRDMVVFDIINLDPDDYHVDHLQALNEFGTRDHAKFAEFIGSTQPEHNEGPLIVPAGARVQAGLLLRDVETIGRHITLSMSEPNHLRPVTSDPITYAPIRWSRGPVLDLTDPPDENEGRLGIHIQAVGGVIWLSDGVPQDPLDATGLQGLGARITYGLSKRLSFETEIMGAQTGEACFAIMDGELTRSAAIGRVQGGLLMRLGEGSARPFVRLGLGLQGASHTDELLMEDGSRVPRPGSDIAVDGLISFGGGLDIRLGKSFAAGITASFEKLLSSDTRSIGAGIHLGYTLNH